MWNLTDGESTRDSSFLGGRNLTSSVFQIGLKSKTEPIISDHDFIQYIFGSVWISSEVFGYLRKIKEVNEKLCKNQLIFIANQKSLQW